MTHSTRRWPNVIAVREHTAGETNSEAVMRAGGRDVATGQKAATSGFENSQRFAKANVLTSVLHHRPETDPENPCMAPALST